MLQGMVGIGETGSGEGLELIREDIQPGRDLCGEFGALEGHEARRGSGWRWADGRDARATVRTVAWTALADKGNAGGLGWRDSSQGTDCAVHLFAGDKGRWWVRLTGGLGRGQISTWHGGGGPYGFTMMNQVDVQLRNSGPVGSGDGLTAL